MEIKGRDILKIKTLKSKQAYSEDSSFKGQFYNTYLIDGKPCNVNTNDEFVQWRDAGILYSADFKPTTYQKEVDGELKTFDSLQLLVCTNINQEIAMAKTEATLNKIYRDAELTTVDADFMGEFIKD